ncbi:MULTISPECIES: class I SAM-dependent methyltransferase [Myxococcus]|uniref:class I SAM-dependent methyltransferase n=1 Tax=Myxococcus TaxID=32 RepID=UPI001142EDAA|nr:MULTISPECIES: class I SAM-dependent methyltransferase [Myxococcus]MCK8499413.1 methyltransferase domain-containing protein [Myxococcus fulvus]
MTTHPNARFWDAIAERYAKKPLPNPAATARKLALSRDRLRPTDRLLDVGCGTGSIVLELAPHVAEAHGVDISRNMIAIAHRKAAAAGTANVVFHAQPAGTLDAFTDAQFDCVCAYNLLHLLDDPAALLHAMYRVTVPGGTLVTSTACLGGPLGPMFGGLLAVMRWLGKAPRVTVLRRDELRAAVADAGFVDIETPDVGDSAQNVFLMARKPR